MNSRFIAANCVASSLALALTVSGPASAQNASMTSSMSAASQATTKTLVENDNILVRETISHPGDGTAMQSRLGRAFYYLSGGTSEMSFADGTKKVMERKSASAAIITEKRPYSTKNVGKTTIHVISFTLKTDTAPAAAQPARPPMAPGNGTATVLVENDRVAVVDRVTPPGGGSAMGVARPGVAYYVIKGGTYEFTFADGTKQMVTHKTGEAYITSETRPYSTRNTGKSDIHQIIFRPK